MARFAIVPSSILDKTGFWNASYYCARANDAELDKGIEQAQITLRQAKLRILRLGIEKSNLKIREHILRGMGVTTGG